MPTKIKAAHHKPSIGRVHRDNAPFAATTAPLQIVNKYFNPSPSLPSSCSLSPLYTRPRNSASAVISAGGIEPKPPGTSNTSSFGAVSNVCVGSHRCWPWKWVRRVGWEAVSDEGVGEALLDKGARYGETGSMLRAMMDRDMPPWSGSAESMFRISSGPAMSRSSKPG